MNEKPAPEEVALWQRRLAGQANNRAWSLAEQPSRNAEEDEEMLEAAHAAMFFWKIVGNVAAASGKPELHREHFDKASEQVAALPDAEDRSILEATLRVIPAPGR